MQMDLFWGNLDSKCIKLSEPPSFFLPSTDEQMNLEMQLAGQKQSLIHTVKSVRKCFFLNKSHLVRLW